MSKRFLPALRLAFVLLCGLLTHQATAQTWQWAATTSSSGTKAIRRSATDAQGNTYIIGDFTGMLTFGNTQLYASGYQDAFVAKCSPTGQWLWAKSIQSAGADYAYGLAVDANGDAYVGGGYGGGGCYGGTFTLRFGSTILTAGVPGQCGGTPAVAYVAKISSDGTWQWGLGANVVSYVLDVAVGPNGTVFAAGTCNRQFTLGSLSSAPLTTNQVTDDAFVARFNGATGQGDWLARALVNGRATSLAVDASGNATICGRYYKTGTMQNLAMVGTTLLPSNGVYNWFAARVDATGEWTWATSVYSAGPSVPNQVAVNAAGETFISGYVNGVYRSGTQLITTNTGNLGAVAKVSPDGVVQWVKPIPGVTTSPLGVLTDQAGNAIVTGEPYNSTTTFGTIALTNATTFIAKMSAAGTWQWAKPLPVRAINVSASPTGVLHVSGDYFGTLTLDALTLTSTGSDLMLGRYGFSAPTISTLSPASGPIASTFSLQGSGFEAAQVVKIGATKATFSYVSPTELTVSVPVGATSGPVTVVSTGGTVISSGNFTVVPPSVSSFAPATAQMGATVTITGAGFAGATGVKFGTAAATTFTVVSPTTVTAVVPVGAATGRISVVAAGGTAISTVDFTVAPPAITLLTPATAAVGATVTIDGTGFTAATGVRFGTVAAVTFRVVSDVRMTAVVPPGATTGKVGVTGRGGTGLSVTNFTLPAPVITTFAPLKALAGTSVTITGTGFAAATGVMFGTRPATSFTVLTATILTAIVPAGGANGVISVTTSGGTGRSATAFALLAPTLTTFSPASGAIGTLVTITGTGFSEVTGVRFGTLSATAYTVVSATRITATLPAGATTGAISVLTAGGTGSSATSFTVALPTLTAFAPTTGARGATVTIYGTGFTGATGVRFGTVAATTFTVVSGSSITAVVPPTAITGKLSVVALGGTAQSAANFTVTGARPAATVAATPAEDETAVTTARLLPYPNPAHGTVSIPLTATGRQIILLDATGLPVRTMVVSEAAATEASLSLDGLRPGIYTVRVGAKTTRLTVE
jgi:IPT/TIG domain